MLYREIMAVCSQIHTKHINTLCGQSVEFSYISLYVYPVTTGVIWPSNMQLSCTINRSDIQSMYHQNPPFYSSSNAYILQLN